MLRYGVPILIVLVLLASGCINPSGKGNGVVIEDFSPSFEKVYPGEPIQFFLKFKNTGSVEAENVFAELLGLDEDWALSSAGMGNEIVGGEVLPREERCQYTSSEHLKLSPPYPSYGTEGGEATCTWIYKTPDIPSGTGTEYKVTARVFYDYHTTLIKSFTLAPAQELLRYNEQGKSIPSSTVSSTDSPITLQADARDPIRFWGNDMISFPIAINIENTGGGMACIRGKCKKTSPGGHEWNSVTLKITPKSDKVSLSDECARFMRGSTVDVWTDKGNTVICNIEVSGLGEGVGYQEKLIEINAEYSYFTDAETSITII